MLPFTERMLGSIFKTPEPVKQVVLYTHPMMPVPFLWNIADDLGLTLALKELFLFLDDKGCYQELTDDGLEFHRAATKSFQDLRDLLATDEIPPSLQNEARWKVEKQLPGMEKLLGDLEVQALLYAMALEGNNEAVRKLLTLRQEKPNETWVLLQVQDPTGAAPPQHMKALPVQSITDEPMPEGLRDASKDWIGEDQ